MSKYQFVLDQLGLKSIQPKIYRSETDIIDDHLFSENRVSLLGTPVFSSVTISDFENSNNTIVLDAALIDLNAEKNISMTPIQGRKGTFKEFISEGDYGITIKGVIFGKNRDYPLKEVKKLIHLCQSHNSVRVSSEFLALFKIFSMVIKSYSLGQSEKQGFLNIQPFSLHCVSDEPVELSLK
ncbi:DUF6046 domain-containing protein [Aureibacter tunicatorum]|uniref:DUF6046 domain-containing protein n=1 Tax=Aureibacter tunicatorum TaxID=866807 RepID=A0AAE3XU19_9BACT|nr:DUF6046 domain-containing protein [Aureibacter tunicatorum]MDR6241964.1 hypothetical protein [Aureibacter tunicatorum]BDD07517.1 hypothetical protein AUTU_50000 [Aureibacter tunicatorum]